MSPYDEAMEALSSLITKRSRADKSNRGNRFDLLFDYLKVLFFDVVLSILWMFGITNCIGFFDGF